eukprot:8632016-Karenia_brevis.AAC.1
MDVQPSWANGAKVFVHSMKPDLRDNELGAYQAVIIAHDEDAIFYASKEMQLGRAVVPSRVEKFHAVTGCNCCQKSANITTSIPPNTFVDLSGHSSYVPYAVRLFLIRLAAPLTIQPKPY